MNKPIFNCKSMIIGHRGSKGDIMENTLESILYAIDTGVDGIEIDVRRCATGEIVLFHDETLDRLAFKDQFYFGNIKGIKINELQWYHLYNTELIDTMGRKFKIPKLIDILKHPKVYMSDVLINIEIKDLRSHEKVGDMISELVDEGLYTPDRFLISSYLYDPLMYFTEYKSDLIKSNQNYNQFKIGIIFFDSVNYVDPGFTHVILDRSLVDNSVINNNKKIFVYTINNKSEYSIGNLHNIVDGIITDKPKYFLNN